MNIQAEQYMTGNPPVWRPSPRGEDCDVVEALQASVQACISMKTLKCPSASQFIWSLILTSWSCSASSNTEMKLTLKNTLKLWWSKLHSQKRHWQLELCSTASGVSSKSWRRFKRSAPRSPDPSQIDFFRLAHTRPFQGYLGSSPFSWLAIALVEPGKSPGRQFSGNKKNLLENLMRTKHLKAEEKRLVKPGTVDLQSKDTFSKTMGLIYTVCWVPDAGTLNPQ